MNLCKYSIELEVRDNELDSQGIVSNDNYMVYLSHARHKHIKNIGVDFNQFAQDNQKLIVLSCEMKFKNTLTSGDMFVVSSSISLAEQPNQWIYKQSIKRPIDNKTILTAKFYSTCVDGNSKETSAHLYIPEIIINTLNG